MTDSTIDTTNKFCIGKMGDITITLMPIPKKLTKDEVLNLCAWLLALNDPDLEEFTKVFNAVCEV